GPRPIPLIGNLHQLPQKEFFKTYASWSKQYGPIVYFTIFGRKFVILNDLNIIDDLLVKRSNIYSTRPHLVMAGELVGRDETSILFLKYGRRLKEVRRILTIWFGKNSMRENYPTMLKSNRRYLRTLLESPDGMLEHIKLSFGSLMMEMAYGIDSSNVQRFISMAEEMNQITSKASKPGSWLCDSFPILAKVPPWAPFAHFRRWAIASRKAIHQTILAPYNATRDSLLRDEPNSSWLAKSMLGRDGKIVSGLEAEDLWTAAAGVYVGAIDTTVTLLYTFYQMMLRHPDVQHKAQAEIDNIIGLDRLPSIEDMDTLPYITNVIREIIRFTGVVPLAPHSLDEDNVYNGYKIPKGSWVVGNIWGVLHDPDIFHNPDDFIPDRYDDTKGWRAEPDLTQAAFGFGRRACPGIYFAHASLFIHVTSVLSAFVIKPTLDDGGDCELPPVSFNDGHIR
ncbi:cytochrome P450, partial [Schizopora paradoxa]